MRVINKKILILKTIIYRLLIIITQIIFTWLFLNDMRLAINMSILWNVLNMIQYYSFEYVFAKHWDVIERRKLNE